MRRLDFILQKTCHTKSSQKGVKYLSDNSSQHTCATLDKVIQSTAHGFRTGVASFQAVQAGLTVLDEMKSMLPSDNDPYVLQLFDSLENCLRLSGTASMHGADVSARLNAFALRSLRKEWLYRSSLNRDLKDRINKSLLCNGSHPEEKAVEFVAPIVGPNLQKELDQDYQVSKKSEQIQKKAQAFKRSFSGSANSSSQGRGAGGRVKRQRTQDGQRFQGQRSSNYNNNAPNNSNQRPTMRFNTSSRGRGRGHRGRGSNNSNNSSHSSNSSNNRGHQRSQRP